MLKKHSHRITFDEFSLMRCDLDATYDIWPAVLAALNLLCLQ